MINQEVSLKNRLGFTGEKTNWRSLIKRLALIGGVTAFHFISTSSLATAANPKYNDKYGSKYLGSVLEGVLNDESIKPQDSDVLRLAYPEESNSDLSESAYDKILPSQPPLSIPNPIDYDSTSAVDLLPGGGSFNSTDSMTQSIPYPSRSYKIEGSLLNPSDLLSGYSDNVEEGGLSDSGEFSANQTPSTSFSPTVLPQVTDGQTPLIPAFSSDIQASDFSSNLDLPQAINSSGTTAQKVYDPALDPMEDYLASIESSYVPEASLEVAFSDGAISPIEFQEASNTLEGAGTPKVLDEDSITPIYTDTNQPLTGYETPASVAADEFLNGGVTAGEAVNYIRDGQDSVLSFVDQGFQSNYDSPLLTPESLIPQPTEVLKLPFNSYSAFSPGAEFSDSSYLEILPVPQTPNLKEDFSWNKSILLGTKELLLARVGSLKQGGEFGNLGVIYSLNKEEGKPKSVEKAFEALGSETTIRNLVKQTLLQNNVSEADIKTSGYLNTIPDTNLSIINGELYLDGPTVANLAHAMSLFGDLKLVGRPSLAGYSPNVVKVNEFLTNFKAGEGQEDVVENGIVAQITSKVQIPDFIKNMSIATIAGVSLMVVGSGLAIFGVRKKIKRVLQDAFPQRVDGELVMEGEPYNGNVLTGINAHKFPVLSSVDKTPEGYSEGFGGVRFSSDGSSSEEGEDMSTSLRGESAPNALVNGCTDYLSFDSGGGFDDGSEAVVPATVSGAVLEYGEANPSSAVLRDSSLFDRNVEPYISTVVSEMRLFASNLIVDGDKKMIKAIFKKNILRFKLLLNKITEPGEDLTEFEEEKLITLHKVIIAMFPNLYIGGETQLEKIKSILDLLTSENDDVQLRIYRNNILLSAGVVFDD